MSHLYGEEEEENTDPRWLHPEAALRTSVGVTFPGRLLGNIALRCSLTAFDFAGRSAVVRECISRVCRAAGRPLGHARPLQLHFAARPPASMAAALANSPVRLADLEVTLSVTATYLTSISLADSQVVLQHHLRMVSFMLALEEEDSGGSSILDRRKSGDARMKKESTSRSRRYVAYVANDGQERLCVVFDCGQRAAEVAKTIGQAFTLCSRTTASTAQQSTNSSDKPLLKPTNHPPLPPLPPQSSPSSSSTLPHIYYNAESVHRRRQSSVEREVQPLEKKAEVEEEEEEDDKDFSSHTDTFICHDTNSSSSSSSSEEEEHFFETLSATSKASTPNSSSTSRPPPPQSNRSQKLDINIPCPADLVDHVLESAPYFHGALSREGAERLLFASSAEDGAFLVRLRANNANAAIISPRQRYIISTRQIGGEGGEKSSSEIHHALLQQADGSVTNDGVYYASVSRMLATALLRGRPLVTTEGRPLRLLAPVQAPLYAAIFPSTTAPSTAN